MFYGGNVVRVLVHFFSLPLIFTLHLWPLAFLILSPLLQNFFVVLSTKKCLLCFFFSALDLCRPFFLVELRLPAAYFSLSLYFSVSIFQICGDDSLSKINTLDNTDTETISAFCFRLY